jgi:AcrR family transcriptional regulator
MKARAMKALKAELVGFKRQRILEVARTLFARDGYDGTSVDAIAQQLEVTKAFVYGYFDSKGDILFQITKHSAELLLKATVEAAQHGSDPHFRMRYLIERMCEIIIDNRDAVKVYLFESGHLAEEQKAVLNRDIRDKAAENIRLFIDQGMQSGDFLASDAGLARLAVIGLVSSMYSWYHEGGRLTRIEIIAFMTDAALRLIGDVRACGVIASQARRPRPRGAA